MDFAHLLRLSQASIIEKTWRRVRREEVKDNAMGDEGSATAEECQALIGAVSSMRLKMSNVPLRQPRMHKPLMRRPRKRR